MDTNTIDVTRPEELPVLRDTAMEQGRYDDATEQGQSDDVLMLESLTPEEAELFEDELEDYPDDDAVDSPLSRIQASSEIGRLPDQSVATDDSAGDSACCIDVHRISDDLLIYAVGACDDRCRLYSYSMSVNKLSLVQTLSESNDTIVAAAFRCDGRYLATGSYDALVRIYLLDFAPLLHQDDVGLDTNTSCIRPTPSLIKNDPTSLMDTPPPPLSLLSSGPLTVAPSLATLVHTLEGPSIDVEWLQWHPKGYAILAGSKDATVWMWMGSSGNVIHVFSGHAAPVSSGTFANRGKVIVTGAADGVLIVWNPKTAEKLFTFGNKPHGLSRADQDHGKGFYPSHREPITCIVAHSTLPIVAAGSEDSNVSLLNVESGRMLGVLTGHTDSIESLAFLESNADDPNGSVRLASGSLDGTIRIWDCSRIASSLTLKHSEIQGPMSNPTALPTEALETKLVGGITKLKWITYGDPATPMLFSASTDSTIRVWDTRSGSCLHVLSGHRDTVLDLTLQLVTTNKHSLLHSHSVLLGSCSDDQTIKIWRF